MELKDLFSTISGFIAGLGAHFINVLSFVTWQRGTVGTKNNSYTRSFGTRIAECNQAKYKSGGLAIDRPKAHEKTPGKGADFRRSKVAEYEEPGRRNYVVCLRCKACGSWSIYLMLVRSLHRHDTSAAAFQKGWKQQ